MSPFELEATEDPTRYRFTPSPYLLTPANTLQGGAALGAAIAAMERVTGRPTIWATAQYLAFAMGGDPLAVDVTVEVTGHNTSQARCVLSRRGTEILTAHAALGSRTLDLPEAVWCAPPSVPPAEACPPYEFLDAGEGHMGDYTELRLARGRQLGELGPGAPRGDGRFAMWVRCWKGEHAVSVADLAFIGDYMPLGFADAIGADWAGNSLDNTIRVGHLATTGWVLLATQVQQVANGFGYGRAELWAQDGTLLGEVSQSVVMRRRDRMHERLRRSV